MSKVYIASPFFNEDQLGFVIAIERAFDRAGIDYYSPRSEGVIMDMTEEERVSRMRYLYTQNINNVTRAEYVLCVIDDFDTGTMFEMGYAAAKGKRIVTISNQGHGLNLMLQQCAWAHVNDINNAVACIMGMTYEGEIKRAIE